MMKRWEWAVLVAFLLSLWGSCFSAFAQKCESIREDTLRLHILANSDSEADQQLKLLVRDQILSETSQLFSGSESHEEAVAAAKEALPQMLDAARHILREQGYDYAVSGNVIPLYFDTRQYNQVILPAGVYDAVQIRIGEAEGKNWWCVLFPPLCVGAALAEPEALSDNAIATLTEIQSVSVEYIPKFAAIEWLENTIKKIRG